MNHLRDEKITNPLSLIEDDHCWQLVLCDGLEIIADSLPHDIDYRLVSLTSEVLKKAIHQHNRLEEEVLFPIITARLDKSSNLIKTFHQLTEEHDMDGEHALEIANELDLITICRRVENPEMLGYMLRGFFDALRRHINWENQTVLPLAAERLTPADLKAILEWVSSHPETSRCRRLIKLVGKHLGHTSCPYRTTNLRLIKKPALKKTTG